MARKNAWLDLAIPVLAIVFALLISVALIAIIGKDPATALSALWKASFGSRRNIGQLLMQSTPLILTGLSVAVAFRCGLFNIGGEGQIMMAQLVAAVVGYSLNLPGFLHLPLAIVAGILAGGVWGAIPGFLKARLGVHEVINTIMLNWIAFRFTYWIVNAHLRIETLPRTPEVLETARLSPILPPSQLTTGLFLALLAAAIIYVFLWRTRMGYELRAVGHNPFAAEYGGINVARQTVLAMTIAGGLAGLAGVIQTLGVQRSFFAPSVMPGYGFTGIAVALLGRNHPVGVVLAALLFGFLEQGAPAMQVSAGVPKAVIFIVQALVIFLVAADGIIRSVLSGRKRKEVTTP